jgi:hypothetical protein
VNKRLTQNPVTVAMPNGTIIRSTHEADLNLPQLTPKARHIHLCPGLHSQPLLSMGQLCDAGCIVTFDKATFTITYNKLVIITGHRTAATLLYGT